MTAEEARKLRYSKEDEKVGHKNTFNLLVSDYINQIDSKIGHVATYTDSLIFPLNELCNRQDIVDEIVKQLKKDGYIVSLQTKYVTLQTKYYFDIKSYVFELYISWNNNG